VWQSLSFRLAKTFLVQVHEEIIETT